MIHLLLAASLSAAVPPATPEPAEVKPAMFVVRDADTTIYIFGTFHALDGQDDWLSGNLRSAFEGSQELMLETMVPRRRTLASFAPSTGPTLAGYNVTPSASLLTTTKVAISAGHSRGMNVANGADMVLRHVAESEGKRVDGLETFDSQLRMFARIPGALSPSTQPSAGSNSGQSVANDLSTTMSDMQSAWKHGDQTVFLRMVDAFRRSSPEAYRVMFTERNARWADWIAARMRSPGTVFVAVGTGHLVGKDSVLVRLAERGIESSRLN